MSDDPGGSGDRLRAALSARAGVSVPPVGTSADDPERVGAYQIVERLGEGGMGVVYLARSPGGRAVALKVVRPPLASDPSFRERFRSEVQAARTVQSAYTAPVIDADVDGPQPWLATSYLSGPTLLRQVREGGPLSPQATLALGAGLAEALVAIHAASIVHRDLKPSNVILADDGPRVVDFGIARALETAHITVTGTLIGSPGFVSPEQVLGRPVGPAADLFSLGSTLVFAATGESPFGDGTPEAVMWRVVHQPPDLGALPPVLAEAIRPLLSRAPEDRPSAAEAVRALADAAARARAEAGVAPWGSRPAPPATATTPPLPSPPTILPQAWTQPAPPWSQPTAAQTWTTGQPPWPQPPPPGGWTAAPAGPRRRPRRVLAIVAAGLVVAAAVAFGVHQAISGGSSSSSGPGSTKTVTFSVPGSSSDNGTTYTLAVTGVVRDGPFSRLEVNLGCQEQAGCSAQSDLEGGNDGTFNGVSIVDPADRMLLQPVVDKDGDPSASALPSTLDAGVNQPAWTTFPALPSSVHKVAVALAVGPTIVDVPVVTPARPWQPTALAGSQFSQPPTDHNTAGLRLLRFPMSAPTSPSNGSALNTVPSPATAGGYSVAVGPLTRVGPYAVLDFTVTCVTPDSSGSCDVGSDFTTNNSSNVIDNFQVRAGNTDLGPAAAGGKKLVSTVPGSVSPGTQVPGWMWFAAPPSGTSTVTVIIPNGPAIGSVPVK